MKSTLFEVNSTNQKLKRMKRFTLLFAMLITFSSSFLACKDVEKDGEETDIMAEDETIETEVFEEEPLNEDFGAFDTNDDNMLDENEFAESNITFEEWDEDDNSSLNDEEFYGSTFAMADANEDDKIDENEWNEGRNTVYSSYAAEDDWNTFDTDGDGFLNNDEWFEGFSDSEWFGDFDENDDEMLDSNEWNSGIFANWDANDDGFLDENEYNDYSSTTMRS